MKKFVLITLIILILFSSGCAQKEFDLPEDKELIAQYKKDIASAEEAKKTLDPSFCIDIPDLDIRDTCYYDAAVAKKNSSICEIMYRQATKDSCYLSIGKATKDVTLCNKIKTLSMQEECISVASK